MTTGTEFTLSFLLLDPDAWRTPVDMVEYARKVRFGEKTVRNNQWAYKILLRLAERGVLARNSIGLFRLRREMLKVSCGPKAIRQVSCSLCNGLGLRFGDPCSACHGCGMLAWDENGASVRAVAPRERADSASAIVINMDHGYVNT